MNTDDIERIVKLYQSVTDRSVQSLLLQLLSIEVQTRGLTIVPKVTLRYSVDGEDTI